RLAQQAGLLGALLVLVGAGGAALQDRLDSPADARVAVAEQGGAVAATQVDVLAAVEVTDAAAGGPVEQHGVPDGPVQARRGGDAPGEVAAGSLILFGHAAHGGLRIPATP